MVKNLPASGGDARDLGLTPGSGSCPGVESGNLLQYSYQEKSIDRGAWQARVNGVTKNETRLSEHACAYFIENFCIGVHKGH